MQLDFKKSEPEVSNILSEEDIKELKKKYRKTVSFQAYKEKVKRVIVRDEQREITHLMIGDYLFLVKGFSKNLGSKQYITLRTP